MKNISRISSLNIRRGLFREFNNLTSTGQMDPGQQIEKLDILHVQIEKASKEGLVLIRGDMNIDLLKWEDPKYY